MTVKYAEKQSLWDGNVDICANEFKGYVYQSKYITCKSTDKRAMREGQESFLELNTLKSLLVKTEVKKKIYIFNKRIYLGVCFLLI